jgi:solute carrier family 25 (mitochondrial carnitine/acylcarnitine transporter), member 20/29
MRLLFLLSVLAPLVASAQRPIYSSTPSISSTTLVDALSADPDYTHLIRLLQRARLIPTLARLNGTTLFAPTNNAIERYASDNSLWSAGLYDEVDYPKPHDNIQEGLRQELLYHMLNGTAAFPQT